MRWEQIKESARHYFTVVDAAKAERKQLTNCQDYNCYQDSQCQKCRDVQENLDVALEALEK